MEFPKAGGRLKAGTPWEVPGEDEHPLFIFKANIQEGKWQHFPEFRLKQNTDDVSDWHLIHETEGHCCQGSPRRLLVCKQKIERGERQLLPEKGASG